MKTRINHETVIEVIDIHISIWELLLEIEGLAPIDSQIAYPVEKDRAQEILEYNKRLQNNNPRFLQEQAKALGEEITILNTKINQLDTWYKNQIQELRFALGELPF